MKRFNKTNVIALVALLIMGVVDAWGLGIKKNVSLAHEQEVGGNQVSWSSNNTITWSQSWSNLYWMSDLRDKDLSAYDGIYVDVASASNNYRIILTVNGKNYTVTTKKTGLQLYKFKDDFKYNASLSKASIRIGGGSNNGNMKLNSVSLHRTLNWSSDGTISFSLNDFNFNGVEAKDNNGNLNFKWGYANIAIDFDSDGINANDIKSISPSVSSNVRFIQRINEKTDNLFNLQAAQEKNVNIKQYQIALTAAGELKYTSLIFYKAVPKFDVTSNRIFFEDFENLSTRKITIENVIDENKKKEYEATPSSSNHMEGKYLNYGGRGKLMNDPTFGQYYQNLADADEYTKSIAENFLRIILTDTQRTNMSNKIKSSGAVTVGFWVNGEIAVNYELPLERGSMFCMFSNERFRKADNYDEKPRFMFDISCNGWNYSYMPNTFGANNMYNYVNQYFYEEPNKNTATNPLVSLFGKKNYANTLDQSQHKFYDDKKWHYVTYVMDNQLKHVTMYLDGEKTGEIADVTKLSGAIFESDRNGNGDYVGRTYYLRNIVLGGFTPHGLFYDKQYYSDAALAYDDIAIYGNALTQNQILSIIDQKGYTPTEWSFGNDANVGEGKGESNGSDVYGLGLSEIGYDEDGYLTMDAGSQLTIPSVPKDYYVRVEYKYVDENSKIKPEATANINSKVLKEIGVRDSEQAEGFEVITFEPDKSVALGNYLLKINSDIVIRSIVITKYQYGDLKWAKKTADNKLEKLPVDAKYVQFYVIGKNTFQQNGKNVYVNNILPKTTLKIDGKDYTVNGKNISGKACYIKYASSAPHVAYVDENGNISMTGIAGNAIISAEIISDNLFTGSEVIDSFEVRVKKEENTLRLPREGSVAVNVNDKFPEVYGNTQDKKLDNITLTVGGWYNTDDYLTEEGKRVKDGWMSNAVFTPLKADEILDEFNIYSLGQQNAKSETYGMNGDWDTTVGNGYFTPKYAEVNNKNVFSSEPNKTPWTLPCRGSYVKFEPVKAGIVTMYILQDGNLEKSEGAVRSDHVYWKPIYITDETGKVIDFVQTATNGRITPNDQFFADDKRRAQFMESIEALYNWDESLRNDLLDLKKNNYERFRTLIDNWANAGWTQKVIPTKDGGYTVMSTAIVRYTFNVHPGKTYYLFSNDAKIGISGFNFEEGRVLDTETETYATAPVRDVNVGSALTFTDVLNQAQPEIPSSKENGKSVDSRTVTYERNFAQNKWGSICLPFSMNNRQLREQFGEETAVVLLKGINEKGKVEMVWHINQDIIAGYPYFIMPRGAVKHNNVANGNITKITADVYFGNEVSKENPLFSVGSTGNTIDWSNKYSNASFSSDYPYVFEGNFKTKEIPAGSYVMSSGKLTKSKNALTIKPFRAYLTFQGTDASKAKLLSMDLDEEETTGIDDMIVENETLTESNDVYSINGTMHQDNKNLSKGVYIINGKKFVVK